MLRRMFLTMGLTGLFAIHLSGQQAGQIVGVVTDSTGAEVRVLNARSVYRTAILEVWLGAPSTTMSRFTASPGGAESGMTMLI